MFNLERLWVSTAILTSVLLAACGGGGGEAGSGSGGGGGGGVPVASVALPETGVIRCTDVTDATIDCANTGQDGDLKAGVAWPNPRFTVDLTGNCITDNLTGLMWARNDNANGRIFGGTWEQSLEVANTLELCGSTDWRMPNRKELLSLVNYGAGNLGLELLNNGFNVPLNFYWSSSSVAGNAAEAWVLILINGVMSPRAKSEGNRFLPVRAGQ